MLFWLIMTKNDWNDVQADQYEEEDEDPYVREDDDPLPTWKATSRGSRP